MKKILFLNSRLLVGGAERMLYEVARRLDMSRFQVKIFCLYQPGPIGKSLLSEGIDLEHSFMRNKFDLRGLFNFFQALKKQHIDILYLETSPLTLFWGFIFARIIRVSNILGVIHSTVKVDTNTWIRFKTRLINRLFLHRLDKIIVVSRAKMDSMIKEYRLDPGKFWLIYNGVDLERFRKPKDVNGLKDSLGISREEKVIGMVARLVKKKGYDVFLKSARMVTLSCPDCRFLIIGDGPERSILENLAKELGLNEKVIFLGERHDVHELVSSFDVAVLSSKDESFPVTLLEYMAAERPIVATDVGGNKELISHRESGFIVPPEDPDILADSIVSLINDNKLAGKMGNLARKRAEKNFSLERTIDQLEKIFINCTRHRVLIAGPHLDVRGGVSSFAKYYLNSELPEDYELVYHPTTIDGSVISKIIFFAKSLCLFFVRLLKDRKVEIVHVLSSSKGSFYRKAIITVVSKFFRKSVIFHIHGSRFDVFYNTSHPLRRFCIKRILGLSDSIIVLSKMWHSVVTKITNNTNIKIIPNLVDVEDFRLIRTRRSFSGLNVFTAGRLERRKGSYDILDIVPIVLKEMPGVKFYLAGDGDVEKIRELCKKRGIEKNVMLLGWINKDRLLAELKNASIFLLPSYNEGLPVAILEAMALGLPVISTRVGGIPELVEEGRNGFLVNPGQKQELAARIVGLLRNRELRREMSENNIKKIDSMFSLERVADRFFAEYRYTEEERLSHA